jgi:LmbE family N-acetylglucosaminyl deacetylase
MFEPTEPPEMISVHGPNAPDLPQPLVDAACHRFVSPHCDDITLSCGGTVARVIQAGLRAEVTVVFGSEPDPAIPLSPFAEYLHARWGLASGRVVANRRAEEVVAAALLGSNLGFLPFRDAIYRDSQYLTYAALFGEPTVDEEDLPDGLAEALGVNDPPESATRIYCPMAIGGHVDHRHAFSAGVKLSHAGWAVCFYEDLPYALQPGATESRLSAIKATGLDLQPIEAIDVASTWKLKVLSIMAYGSQLPDLFDSLDGRGDPRARIDDVMRAYALRAGNGALCERFWRLAPGVKPG